MSKLTDDSLGQLDDLLSLPKQIWLLGAGISKEAGVPLMAPLTQRIATRLDGQHRQDYEEILGRLTEEANVEDLLTRIGNLIALAEDSRHAEAPFGDERRDLEYLRELHAVIREELRWVIRWGYRKGGEDEEEQVGSPDNPVITVRNHQKFVRALFDHRRAGLEQRPPVALFTTNYDTLLEDALALCRVPMADGFSGGATAFWRPEAREDEFLEPFKSRGELEAKLYKLHGSIDWFSSKEDVVVRKREGVNYPSTRGSRLLVYPQATKFESTRQAPFSGLFQSFRRALNDPQEGVMGVCGYGFGDRHINAEIESALQRSANQVTLLCFVSETPSLPSVIEKWLSNTTVWQERLLVVTDQGFYHGTPDNKFPGSATWGLWTFEGLTRFLAHGPEVVTDV